MSRFDGLSERSRVLPAVVASAAIFAFTVAAQIFMSATYFGTALLQGSGYQSNVFGALLSPQFLLVTLAFSVGVFALLWLFAPLSAELRLGSVIARSLLAVLAGAVVTFIVTFAIQMQAWLAGAQFFANSLGQATESFARDGGNAFGLAVSSSIQLAVNALPLTVLAVVLTWSWRVRHPVSRRESAPSAEV
ncbi:MAG TPA: hypothetical protein VN619_12160 [Lacisediminihabitans sp.]|jgi:hypothetical protein|nr:hypothetical protein [Lacisediminihabitans sp.]HXD62665.1 hypothetical protein [Lacisediminihabitans sp.]